jgi:hypothetical protein
VRNGCALLQVHTLTLHSSPSSALAALHAPLPPPHSSVSTLHLRGCIDPPPSAGGEGAGHEASEPYWSALTIASVVDAVRWGHELRLCMLTLC